MNLELLSKIATAISSLIAACSLVSMYYIYVITRRDEKISKVRAALISCRSLAKQLDGLLSYEMGFENATTIATSNQIKNLTNKVFNIFFNPDIKDVDLDKYLAQNTPSIMAPIYSRLGKEFEEKLFELEKEISQFEFDFPGAARVALAVRSILKNTYFGQKRLMHDEESWKLAIKQIINDNKDSIKDISDFELEIIEIFAGTWLQSMRKGGQENINDAISALDLVVDRYLEKSPSEMAELSKYERSKKMTSIRETKTISDDLLESEKCLDRLLTNKDMLFLHKLSTQIETRATQIST